MGNNSLAWLMKVFFSHKSQYCVVGKITDRNK